MFFPTFYYLEIFTSKYNVIFVFLTMFTALRNWFIDKKTRYFIISFSAVFHEALQKLLKSINPNRHKYKWINTSTGIDVPLLNDLPCVYSRAGCTINSLILTFFFNIITLNFLLIWKSNCSKLFNDIWKIVWIIFSFNFFTFCLQMYVLFTLSYTDRSAAHWNTTESTCTYVSVCNI